MTLDIGINGKVITKNSLNLGTMKGLMTIFRELDGGYRSLATEDTLTDETNTDIENTDAVYSYISYTGYTIPPNYDTYYDHFTTKDSTKWNFNTGETGDSVGYQDISITSEDKLFIDIELDGYEDDDDATRYGSAEATEDLWEKYSTDKIRINGYEYYVYVSSDKPSESRSRIQVIDGSGTSVNLWEKRFNMGAFGGTEEDSGEFGKIDLIYLSSSDEIEVYLDGSLDSTVDVSSLNQTEKYLRFRNYTEDDSPHDAATCKAKSWVTSVSAGYFDTSSSFTYQTSSLESTTNDIIGGILFYDQDQTQIPANTTLTAYASSDGGSNWSEVEDNAFGIPDSEQGTDLRFKFELETSDGSVTPEINKWKYLYLTNINP